MYTAKFSPHSLREVKYEVIGPQNYRCEVVVPIGTDEEMEKQIRQKAAAKGKPIPEKAVIVIS
jgi:hypothetical protein